MNANPMTFNGMRIVISKPNRYEFTTNRSWKERLFSLPFNPFKSTKTEITWSNIMKDGQVIRNENNLHMTEKTWLDLQAAQKEST